MPPFIFTLRVGLYTATLLTISFWAVIIAFVATLLGKRLNTNYYVARTFWHVAGPILGWKFEVEGEEHLWSLKDVGQEGVEGHASKSGRSAVMVGNHQR
jgi:phosphatidylinositol glycan class A protein